MSERDDVQRWRDPDWWRGWNDLTVSSDVASETLSLAGDATSRALSELQIEGWSRLERPADDDVVERLREGVVALRARKMPAVFIWAFDETWMLFGRMHALWRGVLGEGYRSLPCFWAWYIPIGTGTGNSGWPPHRDRSRGPAHVAPDGRPSTLTAWISLGRATPANGCIYVVPAPFTANDRKGIQPEHARAVPADPGDILIWRQDIWHWGGRSSRLASEPRISVGLEFQAGSNPRYERPLLDPLQPPTLDHRLALIGANIGRYQGFVKNHKLVSLGRELTRLA